jgi:hypothetical protein
LKFKTVADILERERDSTITEWLTRVKLVVELTNIPLSDANRTSHLPKIIAKMRIGNSQKRMRSFMAAMV